MSVCKRGRERVCEGACVCSMLSWASNDLRVSHSLVQVSGLLKTERAVVTDHD